MIEINEKDGAVTFKARVQPRASRTEVVGEHAGAIKLRICSPPLEGKANDECRRLIAKMLGVASTAVEIVSGASSKDKLIRVRNITAERVRQAF